MTEYGQKFFTRFIKETGVRRFINFSDNEHAMVALKDAAAQAQQRHSAAMEKAQQHSDRLSTHLERVEGSMRTRVLAAMLQVHTHAL